MTKKPAKIRRTKEEIADERAAAEAKRAERIAAMKSACEESSGLACTRGCTRGCARRVTSRKAAEARSRKRKRVREAVTATLDQRQVDRAKEQDARAKAIRFEARQQKTIKLERERWQVEVLYLVGHTSKEKIAGLLYSSEKERVGPINRVITNRKLVDFKSLEARVARLVELDRKAPKGLESFIDRAAANAPKKGLGLLDEIIRIRGIKPELVVIKERTRMGERFFNAGASALQVVARGGGIEEWNLQAGLKFQNSFHHMQGNSIGTIDYTRDIVDGGRQFGDSLTAIAASKAYSRGKEAIEAAFKFDGTAEWRWAIIDHVVLQDRPLKEFRLPRKVSRSSAIFLNDALAALATAYHTLPAGVRPVTPSSAQRTADELLEEAVLAAALLRISKPGKG